MVHAGKIAHPKCLQIAEGGHSVGGGVGDGVGGAVDGDVGDLDVDRCVHVFRHNVHILKFQPCKTFPGIANILMDWLFASLPLKREIKRESGCKKEKLEGESSSPG